MTLHIATVVKFIPLEITVTLGLLMVVSWNALSPDSDSDGFVALTTSRGFLLRFLQGRRTYDTRQVMGCRLRVAADSRC